MPQQPNVSLVHIIASLRHAKEHADLPHLQLPQGTSITGLCALEQMPSHLPSMLARLQRPEGTELADSELPPLQPAAGSFGPVARCHVSGCRVHSACLSRTQQQACPNAVPPSPSLPAPCKQACHTDAAQAWGGLCTPEWRACWSSASMTLLSKSCCAADGAARRAAGIRSMPSSCRVDGQAGCIRPAATAVCQEWLSPPLAAHPGRCCQH